MRRLLGTLALLTALLLLAACGDDETATPVATDSPASEGPAPTTSTGPTESGVEFEVRELVSGTAGGGTVAEELTPIATPDDAEAFIADLSPDLADDVELATASNPAQQGEEIYAAVVSIGCDVPPGVDVTATEDGYAVVARKVIDPTPECFAPVTTVAVVAVRVG